MLAGIGGRTIAEARERLSYDEVMAWMAYIGKRGTLNQGMRLEGVMAQVCLLIVNAAGMKKADGGKFDVRDFMPHADQPETEEMTVDNILRALGAKR